jgi:hypothetical protein
LAGQVADRIIAINTVFLDITIPAAIDYSAMFAGKSVKHITSFQA